MLTDVHLMPSYDPQASAACRCRTGRGCLASPRPLGRHGCNAPERLLATALGRAAEARPRLWLLLGDLVDHTTAREGSKGQAVFAKALQRIAGASGGRCALALGNNDVFPSYAVDFEAESYFLPQARELQRSGLLGLGVGPFRSCGLSSSAFESFKRWRKS